MDYWHRSRIFLLGKIKNKKAGDDGLGHYSADLRIREIRWCRIDNELKKSISMDFDWQTEDQNTLRNKAYKKSCPKEIEMIDKGGGWKPEAKGRG